MAKNIDMGFYLKALREEADMTQGDVAKRLRYTTPQFISNWERGVSLPPIKVIHKLACLYRADTVELINRIYDVYVESLERQRFSVLKKYA